MVKYFKRSKPIVYRFILFLTVFEVESYSTVRYRLYTPVKWLSEHPKLLRKCQFKFSLGFCEEPQLDRVYTKSTRKCHMLLF